MIENKCNKLNEIICEYIIVILEKSKSNIHLCNDQTGREISCYYYKNEMFCISENFWDICTHLNINEKDIDEETVYEYILLNYIFDEKTIIKNLYLTNNAMIISNNYKTRINNNIKY